MFLCFVLFMCLGCLSQAYVDIKECNKIKKYNREQMQKDKEKE